MARPRQPSVERLLADCRDYLTAVPQADESALTSRLSDRATTALLRLRERFAAELKLLGWDGHDNGQPAVGLQQSMSHRGLERWDYERSDDPCAKCARGWDLHRAA